MPELTKRADVLENSLNWWRAAYNHVKVGKHHDVTPFFEDSKSKIFKDGFRQGKRVYAVPIEGGKGAFDKWVIKDGKIQRDSQGNPKIKDDWQTITAAFICSGTTRNIGSDELIIPGTKTIEGIDVRMAKAVQDHLKINPEKDSYLLFLRHPHEISNTVNELGLRINYIKGRSPGSAMMIHVNPYEGVNVVEVKDGIAYITDPDDLLRAPIRSMLRTTHPFIGEAMVHYIMRTDLNSPEELATIQRIINEQKKVVADERRKQKPN